MAVRFRIRILREGSPLPLNADSCCRECTYAFRSCSYIKTCGRDKSVPYKVYCTTVGATIGRPLYGKFCFSDGQCPPLPCRLGWFHTLLADRQGCRSLQSVICGKILRSQNPTTANAVPLPLRQGRLLRMTRKIYFFMQLIDMSF